MPESLDRDRMNFITQFRINVIFDPAYGLWKAASSCHTTLEKTPRKAIDVLMKFTLKKGV